MSRIGQDKPFRFLHLSGELRRAVLNETHPLDALQLARTSKSVRREVLTDGLYWANKGVTRRQEGGVALPPPGLVYYQRLATLPNRSRQVLAARPEVFPNIFSPSSMQKLDVYASGLEALQRFTTQRPRGVVEATANHATLLRNAAACLLFTPPADLARKVTRVYAQRIRRETTKLVADGDDSRYNHYVVWEVSGHAARFSQAWPHESATDRPQLEQTLQTSLLALAEYAPVEDFNELTSRMESGLQVQLPAEGVRAIISKLLARAMEENAMDGAFRVTSGFATSHGVTPGPTGVRHYVGQALSSARSRGAGEHKGYLYAASQWALHNGIAEPTEAVAQAQKNLVAWLGDINSQAGSVQVLDTLRELQHAIEHLSPTEQAKVVDACERLCRRFAVVFPDDAQAIADFAPKFLAKDTPPRSLAARCTDALLANNPLVALAYYDALKATADRSGTKVDTSALDDGLRQNWLAFRREKIRLGLAPAYARHVRSALASRGITTQPPPDEARLDNDVYMARACSTLASGNLAAALSAYRDAEMLAKAAGASLTLADAQQFSGALWSHVAYAAEQLFYQREDLRPAVDAALGFDKNQGLSASDGVLLKGIEAVLNGATDRAFLFGMSSSVRDVLDIAVRLTKAWAELPDAPGGPRVSTDYPARVDRLIALAQRIGDERNIVKPSTDEVVAALRRLHY